MTRLFPVDEDLCRRALKRPDAWWAVLVVDRFAVPVLGVLVRIPWVTPMRLTLTGAVLGLAAVAAFGTGHLVLGAALFELRFFFDCLDGKLARARRVTSQRGAFLDFATDVGLISSSMGALGWHLSQPPTSLPLALPAACTVGCLILFWLILYDLDHPGVKPRRPIGKESALGRWRRHHRLARLPGTVEVENFLLFIAPLTGNLWLMTASFLAACAYYGVASVDLFVRLLRGSAPASPAVPEDPQRSGSAP